MLAATCEHARRCCWLRHILSDYLSGSLGCGK